MRVLSTDNPEVARAGQVKSLAFTLGEPMPPVGIGRTPSTAETAWMAQDNEWWKTGGTPVESSTDGEFWKTGGTPVGDPAKPSDGPLSRGFNKAKQSASITGSLIAGDARGAAQTIQQADDYARNNPGMAEGKDLSAAWQRGEGVMGGIGAVAGEFAKDWREAPGLIGSLRATGKNLRAMGEGIVEQTPNMIAPTIGMIGGGLAGSAAMPGVGTVAGAWLGASAGNTLAEGGGMAQEAIQKAGINPQDTAAVERYLASQGNTILGEAATKGAIIGAVDTATAGIGGKLLNAPARAATSRALAELGVDTANKAAVNAAMQTPEFAAKVATDAAYKASMTGAGNVARNAGVAALDPAGEFAGEYLGQGVATGDWDTKNAALEALSSVGQSGIMFAGQKAYQAATRPTSGVADGIDAKEAPPVAPPVQPNPLALPAPSIVVGPDGTATTAEDRNTRLQRIQSGDITDVTPLRETIKPSEAMGLNPAAGAMSAAAAVAVDTGASNRAQQQAADDQATAAAAKAPKAKQDAAKKYAHRVTGTLNGQPITTMVMAATPDEAMASAAQSSPGLVPSVAEPVSKSATQGKTASVTTPFEAQQGRQEEPQAPAAAADPAAEPVTLGQSLTDSGTNLLGRGSDPLQAFIQGNNDARRQAEATTPTEPIGAGTQAAGSTGVSGSDEPGSVPALTPKSTQADGVKSIAQLRKDVDDAPPVTDQHLKAIRALKDAVAKDAESAINSGEAPVYASSTGLTSVITPSAQQPGMFQVTRYNKTGAIGDSQYKSIAEAINDNQIDSVDRLPADKANEHMQKLVDAEAEYQQSRRAKNAAAPPVSQQTATPARPERWRQNALQAGKVARDLGLDPKGKRLAQIIQEVDAFDARSNVQDAPQRPTGTQAQAAPVEASTPDRGDAAAAGGVPAAGQDAGVRADGVETPATFKALLNKKSTKVLSDDGRGRVLYEVDVPAAFRIKHFVNGRLPSVEGLELKAKESVTGNPSDNGYVLIDNRKQLESRKPAKAGAGDVQADGVADEAPTAQQLRGMPIDTKDQAKAYADGYAKRLAAEAKYGQGRFIGANEKPWSVANADLAEKNVKANEAAELNYWQKPYEEAIKEFRFQGLPRAKWEAERKKRGLTTDAKAPAEPVNPIPPAKKVDRAASLRKAEWKKNPLRSFLGQHGLSIDLAKEFAPGITERRKAMVGGYGPIFRRAGKSLDLLAETAREEGFISADQDATDLYELIARVFRGERVAPMFTADAAQDEMQSRMDAMQEDAAAGFDDFMAEQQATGDPLASLMDDDYTLADLDGSGYAEASPEIKAEVAALSAQLEAMGEDSESIRERIALQSPNATEQEYHEHLKDAITAAIEAAQPAGRGDTGQDDGEQGQAREGTSESLTAPTRADIEAQQDRAEQAAKSQSAADKAAEAKAAKERGRADVKRLSESAADTFELGGDAMANLTGQRDVFGAQGDQFSIGDAPRKKNIDKEYMAAIERGDMDAAQKMVDQAARDAGYISGSDYRMAHQAPDKESGENLVTLRESGLVPDDYWTRPDWYQSTPDERSSWYEIKKLFGFIDARKQDGRNPQAARIKMYRAVPKSVKDDSFRDGDWITPSREYAQQEGQMIPEGYRVIVRSVMAKDIWWDGNSIQEFGYDSGQNYAYKNTKNNRKLVDVITRDDDGGIIPLSKRFNARSDDVRFDAASGSPTATTYTPASTAQQKAVTAFAERLSKNRDSFVLMDAVKPSGARAKEAQSVSDLAKTMFGREVVFVKFKGRPLFNGAVSTTDPGKVFVNIESARPMMAVLGHELLHELRKSNPAAYNQLAKTLKTATKDGFIYEAILKQKYSDQGLNWVPQDISEELYGDIVGDNFMDPKFWEAIAGDKPIFAKQLYRAVMNWLDKIANMFRRVKVRADGSMALTVAQQSDGSRPFGTQKYLSDVEAARTAVAQAMRAFSGQAGKASGKAGNALSVADRQDQTQSEAFKKWFGASKVVDADGKPLRVFHGTKGDFAAFDAGKLGQNTGHPTSGLGFFFSADPGVSDLFTEQIDETQWPRRMGQATGANTMPVYLAVTKPFEMTMEQFRAIDTWPFGPDFEMEQPKAAARQRGVIAQNRAKMIAAGYDGIRVKGDPSMADTLGADEWRADTWVAFNPEQIKSATGNAGTFDASNPDIRFSIADAVGWGAPETSWFDDFVYKAQDKQIDTKRVVESIKATAGQLSDAKNVYLQEELFHGRAAARTEEFVNKELSPLVNLMRLRGIDIPTLDEYLHARHAEEANKLIAERNKRDDEGQIDIDGKVIESPLQDGGSGMTTEAARDYLAKLDPAQRSKLEAVAAKVDAILGSTRQLYADYGLESQAKVDGWGDMFDHYVPLMREDKDGAMGIGQGFSIKGKEVKGRTGSTRKVVDILANIALQRERAIVRGEKNRVATALVGLAKANPNPKFWEFGPVSERRYNERSNSVELQIKGNWKSDTNVVVAKIKMADGSVVEKGVVFNEDNERAVRMASALKNLDAAQLEGLLGVSAKITRYFAAINTQYNPVFGTVNLLRDVQGALFNLTSTPLKGKAAAIARHTASALKGIYLDARAARDGKTPSSPWATLWEEFQQQGGQTGFRDLFTSSADRAQAIERELNPTAWMDSPLGQVFTANGTLKVPLSVAQKKATGLFDWLSDYNLAMENAVRVATYKVALEQGMSQQQAASIGKNLTVNFNRKGQVGQQAGALYAFFNASMQGTARLGQTLFDMEPGKPKTLRMSATGKKIIYGGILLGSMQAMLLAAAGFDDEEPPDFVRERSLIIPTGGKNYITIPMPLGLHVLPNLGRIPTEFALGGFKNPAKHMEKLFTLLTGAFNPMGGGASLVQMLSPTAVDPLVALAENKDWTGKPIAKTSYNQATPGHLLTKDTASYPSKLLSEAINILSGGTEYSAGILSPTPDQIDYLFGQVTGGVGREVSKVQQSASAALSGEELPPHKIPLLGRFYGNADSQSSRSASFYSAINELNVHEAEIKGLRKDGRGAEASQYLRDNPEARLFMAANAAERDVQKLRGTKRELVAKGASAEQVRDVERRISERMARFNEAVQRLREKESA